jgi:hypothetical protein
MPYHCNYPSTVREVLDRGLTFRPAARRAVRRFARSRPWQGTPAERKAKFRRLNRGLAHAYGIAAPALQFGDLDGGPSGYSAYSPLSHTIVLRGRLSVVTFLHEFAHARGFDERHACRWSLNLFRRCFPRSFGRCRQVGHLLVRASILPTFRKSSGTNCCRQAGHLLVRASD